MSLRHGPKSQKLFRTRLMLSTATAAGGWAFLGGAAHAAIPAECTVDGPPTVITCELPAPDTLGEISTNTDYTTVIIGSEDVPTALEEDSANGVIMIGNGTQTLVIAEGSSVSSSVGLGVLMAAAGPDGTVTISGNGDISGEVGGVLLTNGAGGSTSVSANSIKSGSGTALYIQSVNDAKDITVDVGGLIDGGNYGLQIDSLGNRNITASLGSVSSVYDAIRIVHQGDGDIQVDSSGDILSQAGFGAYIIMDGEGDLAFANDGVITGDIYLISHSSQGLLQAHLNEVAAGPITLYAADAGNAVDIDLQLSGDAGERIQVVGVDGDISMITQAVTSTAPGSAVSAASTGAGDINILTQDLVTGRSGIVAANNGAAGDISVETASVTSTQDIAVQAVQTGAGAGDISVLTHGDITSAAEGIVASHNGTGSVSVSAEGGIDSVGDSIIVWHGGTGDISVETTGDITSGDRGILATAAGATGGISIDAQGDITAAGHGISALVQGTGDLSIQTAGTISAVENAIRATHFGNGDLTIDATGLLSGEIAVNASHQGTGSTIINTGDAIGSVGAYQTAGGSDVFVTVDGNVTSTTYEALTIYNTGTGVTSATIGDAISEMSSGIKVETYNGTATKLVSTGLASGTDAGAIVLSDADVTLDLNDVSASAGTGASLITSGAVDAILRGTVTGSESGIYLETAGDTETVLATLGAVTGETANGIEVQAAGGGDVTVSSQGQTTGAEVGVLIRNDGAGSLSVSVADASGTDAGVGLSQGLDGLDLDLTVTGTASATTGVGVGIENGGSGATAVAVNTATSESGVGMVVNTAYGTGTSVNVSGGVSGGQNGAIIASLDNLAIDINNASASAGTAVRILGDADIDATFRGDIAGTIGGISLETASGGVYAFAIAEGASVDGGGGVSLDFTQVHTDSFLELTNAGHIYAGGLGAVRLSDTTAGDVFTNSGTIEGFVFMGAGDDALTNTGSIFGTLLGDAGSDTFSNNGLFRGNVFDVDGFGILNGTAGVIESMGPLALGGGTLTNLGTLSSGGAGEIFATELDGNYTQGEGGTMLVDVDGDAGTADQLLLNGAATLSGTVSVNFLNPVATEKTFLIVSAGGGVNDAGLMLADNTQASPALSLFLDFANPFQLYLTTQVDFTPEGLPMNANQTEIAGDLDDVFDADPEALGALTSALVGDVGGPAGYLDAINQLVPEIYLNTLQTSLLASQEFSRDLEACSDRNGVLLSDGRSCAKLTLGSDVLEAEGTYEAIGFEDGRFKVQAGYFRALSDTLTLGLGVGFDDTYIRNDIKSRAQGQRFEAGASLFYRNGGLQVGGATSAGFTNYDVQRRIDFAGFNSRSSGEQDIRALTGELTVSYQVDFGDVYVKPSANLVATHLQSDSLKEAGGIDTDYAIDEVSGWRIAAQPSLEIGGDLKMGEGNRFQPYVRGGATVNFDNDFSLSGSFVGGPAGVSGFLTQSELERTLVDVDAGMRFLFGRSSSLTTEYTGRFSDTVESHGLRFRASFAF
ncbi:MAG TPA: autotransporter domain-containing protein [Hyphomonas sp.]|nr:autotransporter domain-containing protein [Hyphomonas sp.]